MSDFSLEDGSKRLETLLWEIAGENIFHLAGVKFELYPLIQYPKSPSALRHAQKLDLESFSKFLKISCSGHIAHLHI
jgi:hypothetical protein